MFLLNETKSHELALLPAGWFCNQSFKYGMQDISGSVRDFVLPDTTISAYWMPDSETLNTISDILKFRSSLGRVDVSLAIA
ncbi:MAG: hypothetical protein WBE68_14650 [Candidatus Nitrosopolaris sp.]